MKQRISKFDIHTAIMKSIKPNLDITLNTLLPDSAVPSEDWLGGVQGLRARGGQSQQVECQTLEAGVKTREGQQ